MKPLQRAALAAFVVAPFLMPMAVLADNGSNAVARSPGTYYVTQIGDGAIARVVVGSDGSVKVDSNYIAGLPTAGPDSAVFATDGTMLTSNFGAGSISRVDVGARKVLTEQVNKVLISTIADLALDPSSNAVWGIVYSGSGPTAISRVDLATGNTSSMNPDGLTDMGGIAITETGSRIFVSSHAGYIAEVDKNGHQVRKLTVQGSPDGLSYDPSSGYLFAAGCGGICEIDTGGAAGSRLALLKTFNAVDGDGIAADGNGHVFVAKSTCGSLCRLDLSTGTTVTISDAIPAADDVVPLTGAGAGGTCKTLGSCFDGAAAAGLAAASLGLVVFMGAAGFGAPRPTPLPMSSAAHGDAAHGTTVAHAGGAHTGATSHLAAGPGSAAPHPPPAPPATATTASTETTHLQEEAGDKLLEAGGAGLEHGVEAEAGAGGAGGLGGAARIARDDDEGRAKQTPAPPPPEPPQPPQPPQPPLPPPLPPEPPPR